MTVPSISVVMTAYNAEQFVGEALAGILGQSHPPDEVIVVDDGSTDGTSAELRRLGDSIRVIRQPNAGHTAALSRGYAAARGDYIAKCDADDIWMPAKLERHVAAFTAHPEIDVAFTKVWVFGSVEGPWGLFDPRPGVGLLEPRAFMRALYRVDCICASSSVVRRSLYERLGPWADHVVAEDYDFWLRALGDGAVFHYDPEIMVRYRRHDGQMSDHRLRDVRAGHEIHVLHAGLVDDRRLARSVIAADLRTLARLLVDEGRHAEARAAFAASLRQVPHPKAAAWAALLSAPARHRPALLARSVALARRVARPVADGRR